MTTNFKRLNLYLADAQGSSRGAGPSLVTGINTDPAPGQLPTAVILQQNFPNPFNGQTVISFSIPTSLSGSPVDLVVFDLLGRRLRTLLHQKMPAGTFLARWNGDRDDGTSVASVVYFYRLIAGGQMRSARMMYIR